MEYKKQMNYEKLHEQAEITMWNLGKAILKPERYEE